MVNYLLTRQWLAMETARFIAECWADFGGERELARGSRGLMYARMPIGGDFPCAVTDESIEHWRNECRLAGRRMAESLRRRGVTRLVPWAKPPYPQWDHAKSEQLGVAVLCSLRNGVTTLEARGKRAPVHH